MADRKNSPDVLAELLAADLPPAPAPDPQPASRGRRSPKSQPPADRTPWRAPQAALGVAPASWETEIVTFQEHRGWRPRFVNGVELPNWLGGPLVHDYVALRGKEGWELAAASAVTQFYGVADGLQLYFKRQR